MKRIKSPKNPDKEKMALLMTRLPYQVHVLSKKLCAYGFLLEQHGNEDEGTTQLQGLGIAVNEVSSEIFELWKILDLANVLGFFTQRDKGISDPP